MQQLANTLYVMTQGAYLHLDHDTVRIEIERETRLRVPLLQLGAVVTFGNVMLSPQLMARCAEDGLAVTLLDRGGRFKARVVGPTSGNVLLRRAQYSALEDSKRTLAIARHVVAGKLQNSRQVLARGAREATDGADRQALGGAAREIAQQLTAARECGQLDALRGTEGAGARAYFGTFDRLVREDRPAFQMNGRNRRPPLDRMNALLSFCYALLLSDCIAALEGVGLDPQAGYLHALRPGRPALGLDLMEELRAPVADRLALTLINRRQLARADFEQRPGGAVSLTETGRKRVVTAYQDRKQDETPHHVLGRKAPVGLVPHLQARLLARHLRGDLEYYPPYVIR